MQYVRDKLGQFQVKEIDVKPTQEWGYLCGLVIGDGYICKTKRHNYDARISSTKHELIELFCDSGRKLGFNARETNPRMHKKVFPNGKKYVDEEYTAIISSKRLYELLRPCKLPDFAFEVPGFIFKSKKAIRGFLQGFFDAEGSIQVEQGNRISAASKHSKNLEQIKELLHILKIASYIKDSQIHIWGYPSKTRFLQYIGFRLKAKAERALLVAPQSTGNHYRYSADEYNKALEFTQLGFSYTRIASILNIPRDTIYRWATHRKIPYSVIYQYA